MRRPTILVVDDEQCVVEILATFLQDEGYAVLKARDGAEGLELARKRRPALVITDVMMPRLSGVELVRQLRASEDTARTPAILMSCVPQEPARSGADCFLGKPFDLDVLLALVKDYAPLVPRTKPTAAIEAA